jgi:hypothetical protein
MSTWTNACFDDFTPALEEWFTPVECKWESLLNERNPLLCQDSPADSALWWDESLSPSAVDFSCSKFWDASGPNVDKPQFQPYSDDFSDTSMDSESVQSNETPPLTPGSLRTERSRVEKRRMYRSRTAETETSGKRTETLKCDRCRISKLKVR